jgi:hypothetical protein
MTDKVNLASIAASLGLPCFPCGSDKEPTLPGGFKSASSDPAVIHRLFRSHPGTIIGVPTGAASGWVVVDVDTKHGKDGRPWLEANSHRLPETRTHRTPSGGLHLVFQAPDDIEIRNSAGYLRPDGRLVGIAPGIDLRGEGGYVCVPPSPGYAVADNSNPAPFPKWLIEAYLATKPVAPPPQPMAPRTEPISDRYTAAALDGETRLVAETREGGRNHQLNISAMKLGQLVGAGLLDRGTAEAELTRAALAAGLEPHAIRATINSGMTFGIANPRQVAEREASTSSGPILKIGKGVRGPLDDEPEAEAKETDPTKPLLPLIYFNEFEPNLDVADFVEDLLTEGAMSVVYGESNAGKTFVVTDICCHVATGTMWRERAIEAGGVIYCALEGKHGIGNRIAAFKKAHHLEGVEVPFAVVPVAINLLDPEADRSKLVQTIQVAAEMMGCPVKMVVIDTLSRALAGGNENDSEDMGALVSSADFIRQAVNAHILFIHHSGKDVAKGARGHSLLRAATDTEIEISRPDDAAIGTIKVTKQRDMAKAADMHFSLKVVELGTNRRGKEVTSCVVDAIEPDQAPAARPKRAKLSAGAQVALDCLIRVLGTHGEHRRGLANVPSTVKSVTETEWRRAYYATSSAPSDKARQMAFARAQEALAASKIALLVDSFAWVVTA